MVHYIQNILFIIIRHFSFAVLFFARPRAKVVAFTVDKIPGGPKGRVCKKEQSLWQTCTTREGFSEEVAVVNLLRSRPQQLAPRPTTSCGRTIEGSVFLILFGCINEFVFLSPPPVAHRSTVPYLLSAVLAVSYKKEELV